MDIKKEIKSLLKDLVEVAVTLAIILIVSRLIFGANMLVPLVAVTSCSMLHYEDKIGMVSAAFAPLSGKYCSASIENWENWLIKNNISKETIDKFPLRSGFSIGDMILTVTPAGEGTILPIFSDTHLGDVVIYNRDSSHPGNEPIIHRVVGVVNVTGYKVSGIEGTLDCLTEEEFNEEYIKFIQSCQRGAECLYNEFPGNGNFRFYITKGDNNHGTDQCGPGNGIALPVPDSQLTARGWLRIPYLGWLKLGLNRILGL